MKTSKALFATTLVACLSVAGMASAQYSQKPASTQKPAGTPAAKAAAPAHHSAVTGSVTATVLTVDQTTRQVTLKGEDGAEFSFTADSSVKNLAQVKPGDIVTATYTESIGYVVKKGGTAGMQASQGMSTAPAGEKPAATATSKTTVTVVITAINAAAPSVTFKDAEGNVHTVKVKDPQKLEGVKVGDSVDITYTEALALKVHTPKK